MQDKKVDGKIVLIVVLALALIGAVGYIVYDKIISKSEPTTVTDNARDASQGAVENAKKEVCAAEEKMCFEYPSGWTASQETIDYPARDSSMAQGLREDQFTKLDKLTIAKQGSDIKVSLSSGITGIGGSCSPGDQGSVDIISERKVGLTGYADDHNVDQVRAMALVAQRDGRYLPMVGLATDKTLVGKKQADGCGAVYFGLVAGKNISLGGGSDAGLVSVSTHPMFGSTESPKSFATLDEAKAYLGSQDVKQAFDIIASAHYK